MVKATGSIALSLLSDTFLVWIRRLHKIQRLVHFIHNYLGPFQLIYILIGVFGASTAIWKSSYGAITGKNAIRKAIVGPKNIFYF